MLNILRNELFKYAKSKKFKNASNIYFCPLFSLCDEKTAINNKEKYHLFDIFNFPNKITHSFSFEQVELEGVSFGKATGKLQNIEFLKNNDTSSEKIILYTEFLSPQITQYFDKIVGIVSENGGMLSHLSIIAREQKIPIVTGFKLGKDNIQLGDIIEINGEKGSATKT